MRIATYNVEWFNALFSDDGQMLSDDQWSARHDVTRAAQIEALGIVFTALDADAIMVIEAPDTNGKRRTETALENFANFFEMRACKALTGFANETQQEIALLYDPNLLTAHHDPKGAQTGKQGRPDAPRFDGVFRMDLDIDAKPETVRFSKPPLEVDLRTQSGAALRLIGVHVKSKAPHGARNREEVMRLSIENRRKQLAQCIWLRGRVQEHLDANDSVLVLGDLNDGPGLDSYEKLFGRSGVEIVLGENGDTALYDPHASMALNQRVGAMPVSARFYLVDQKRYMQALLDYIMVSPDIRQRQPSWRIWHPFDDPLCYGIPELREALLVASDHFPVTIDFDI
jgi:endonuclease/exonuclease/phosphatase family metal-dependent hydrolase